MASSPTIRIATAFAVLCWAATAAACGGRHERESYPHSELTAEVPDDPTGTHLPPPPFKNKEIFPCTQCHDNKDLSSNPKRRELKMEHTEVVLRHDEKHRWCLDCHDSENRDVLHLANGTTVTFEESYKLCGQCHGDKYRDWRLGIHGKRTGEWKSDGEKQYLLCVTCHDSHSPRFKPIPPMPPPIPPGRSKP